MKLGNFLALTLIAVAGCKAPAPAPVREHWDDSKAQTPSGYVDSQEREGGHRRSRREGRQQQQASSQQAGERPRRGQADPEATPGHFDFYLLNLSWSPEFCATHGDSAECGKGTGFVVHGLWPQDFTGDYPEDCSDAPGPANPAADTDIIPIASLVQHEWQTHGTCSGLGAEDYFRQVHQAFASVHLPKDVGEGSSLTPQDLLSRFAMANPGIPASSFALSCGNNRLTAIEVCLGKDLKAIACQGVRSCRANVVQVTSR